MKSRLQIVGKPKDRGNGKVLVALERSLSEDGQNWKTVETRYVLVTQAELDTQEKVDAFIEGQSEKAISRGSEAAKGEVDIPLLEGKTVEADTAEALPAIETHPAGPPDEVKEGEEEPVVTP